MPSAATLFGQRLEPLAVGEDVDQTFVGRFPTDFDGATFKYTLTTQPGATPALELESSDSEELSFSAASSGGEYLVTFTVKYRRGGATGKNTLDLIGGQPGAEKLYNFDLWRTDGSANVRIAAGVQPVVTPSRKDV